MTDWANPGFAALAPPPNTRGGSSADRLFEEWPVTLTEFVTGSFYLANPRLSDIQYDAVLHAERVYYPETYRYLALHHTSEEGRRYWSTPVRPVSFLELEWGKGCIAPDEEVYDASSGQWARIADAGELTVVGTMEAGPDGDTSHQHLQSCLASQDRTVARTAGRPFRRGYGRMLKVTTVTGIVNTVYEGHLYSSWATHDLPYKNRYRKAAPVWRAAGSLEPGERIAVVARLPCLNPVPQPDVREVELVGYWLGDGSMPVPGSTQWGLYADSGPGGAQLLARYVSLVESYPGITAKTDLMRSGALRVRATGSREVPSSVLTDVIRKWGLYGSRAWDKRVPREFFSLPDDQLAVFLSALTDTDGSLYLKQGRHGKYTPHFEYATASEGLARDIQRLLYRFGVVSSVSSRVPSYTYKGEQRRGRPSWRVIVASGVYMQRLAAVLRLHGEREVMRQRFLTWAWGRLQQVPEGDIYWDTVKSVEEAGEGEYWDVRVPEMGTYAAGSGPLLSSNSGKDHVSRIAVLRVCYLLLCLRSPQSYYEMPPQDSIHVLNVASNSRQAQRAFFAPLRKAVTRPGNWFATTGEVEVSEGPHRRGRPARPAPGEERNATALLDTIRFPKNIEAVSGHSDADSQEGLNLILGVADEIDAFRTKGELERTSGRRGARESSTTAEAILALLQTSASTRFETYKNIRISWPRYLGSMIQQLVDEGNKDIEAHGAESRHYVSGPYATWEVNPRVRGKQQFEKDYRDDPVMARARYECKPTYAVSPYFANELALRACISTSSHGIQPLEVDYVRDGKAWCPVYRFSPDLYPVQGARYAMHADLAVDSCRAGVALAHVARWRESTVLGSDEGGLDVPLYESRPLVKVDFVIGYEADRSSVPPREIQIRWVGDLVLELRRRGFILALFTADQWQSLYLTQQLAASGIGTGRFSLDRDETGWRNLRDVAYEGRLEMPGNEIAVRELLTLSRMPNGKIDHPALGCFTGDTRVPLLDGREVQISELADGEPAWVYASDVLGRAVPALAVGRRTKQVRQVCDVVLDSGAVVRCTPGHLWRLQDGTYKEAQYLTAEDRLLPLNRAWDFNSGYEKVRFTELVELEEPVWVYDLEVGTYHNFALTAGVFVHNSKDLADAVGGAVSGALSLGGQEDEQGRRAFPAVAGSWGGSADRSLLPIGMPDMAYLLSEDPIPEDVKDREMEFYTLPGGEQVYDVGEAGYHQQ